LTSARRALQLVPKSRLGAGAIVAALLAGCALPGKQTARAAPGESDRYEPAAITPTEEPAPYFVLDGEPFCFAGANNYYLSYKPPAAVLDVLEAAAALDLRVVRLWGFLDRGSLDGSVRNVHGTGHKDGVHFQHWDPSKKRPAYNDGPDGLERLDFVLHHARRLGLKLIVVLTNNWRDFGGMDQYLAWYGLDRHHLFFTDRRVKRAYKDWVHHLLTRVNTLDGVPYREDPAVFAWELANEPRALNFEDFDHAEGWDHRTITRWADEMSAFVKSIAPHHMVAVGDEGFLAGGRDHWAYEAPYGVDHEALTALPHVDFGTYHLYPDHWGTDDRWGVRWIEDHLAVARRLGKPTVLEEYGVHVERAGDISGPITRGWRRREAAYDDWNRAVLLGGGAGALFWILSGIERPGELYPDYDHFTVYRGDASSRLLQGFARRFHREARACTLARGADHGEPSPFVQARPAPTPHGVGDHE
jgi:mannan endo-1,4-beta-mannosidase